MVGESAAAARPAMSVCIPSFNRAESVTRLVRSIASACTEVGRHDIEVVVVLDGSTDDSFDRLIGLVSALPFPLRVFAQDNSGLATTRNVAASHACGDDIWFLDDDMVVTVDALSAHLARSRSGASILTGPCAVVGDDGVDYFYRQRWERLGKVGRVESPDDMSFANTSASRQIFERYQFDTRFRGYGFEDYELAARVLDDGLDIAYEPAAGVTHFYVRSRLAGLRNSRDEGVGRVLFATLHPKYAFGIAEVTPRHFARPLKAIARWEWSWPLWWLARVCSRCAVYLPGSLAGKGEAFSHELALQSGLARGRRTRKS